MTDHKVRVLGSLAEVTPASWDALANPGWRVTGAGLVRAHPAEPRATAARQRTLAPDRPDAVPLSADCASTPAYNPFLSHAFLSALEDSRAVGGRTGWLPRHLVLEDRGRALGAVPAYVKTHSQGEYVFDHGWAHAFERAGGSYYPKLQVAVPFTPVSGPRLLVPPGAEAAERRGVLADALVLLADKSDASSVHATFLQPDDRAAFAKAGWLARTDQQFHWLNRGYRDYQDFLDTLASRKRKQLKRERREAQAPELTFHLLRGSDIREEHWDAFFRFYMDTGSRKWGRPYLNRPFFSLLGERLAPQILLVMVQRAGRWVAGALNMIGSDALYGRYWGCVEEHPYLHFEVCYHQAIDFAIANGLARVEAGAQGEHKLARGYLPVTTHSAHFIAHPALRRAVAEFLAAERREVEAIGQVLAAHAPYRKAMLEEEGA